MLMRPVCGLLWTMRSRGWRAGSVAGRCGYALGGAWMVRCRVWSARPQAMIERAITARPFSWVIADEAYGNNGPLRRFLEDRQVGYVLALSRSHRAATKVSSRRVDAIAKSLPRPAWQRRSCGNGAKGHLSRPDYRQSRAQAAEDLCTVRSCRHTMGGRPSLVIFQTVRHRSGLRGPQGVRQPSAKPRSQALSAAASRVRSSVTAIHAPR